VEEGSEDARNHLQTNSEARQETCEGKEELCIEYALVGQTLNQLELWVKFV
jgi:hypothetical protein